MPSKKVTVPKAVPPVAATVAVSVSNCPDTGVVLSTLNVVVVTTFPAGGLGDFFGPGTTVGIPFAAQLGVRVTF